MINTKDIFSLNLFAQYPDCLPAVDWRLATGDWRLSLVSKFFNRTNK